MNWYRIAQTEFLYHVTRALRMEDIAASGLCPNSGDSNFGAGYYQYSRGKSFAATQDNVSFWFNRVSNAIQFEAHDFPVLLRFQFDTAAASPDTRGNEDTSRGGNFQFTSCVSPESISWWDGAAWQPLDSFGVQEVLQKGVLVHYDMSLWETHPEDYNNDQEQFANAEGVLVHVLPGGWAG